MFASDIRINQSYMKLWAESWGLGFKHSTKPTQAHKHIPPAGEGGGEYA